MIVEYLTASSNCSWVWLPFAIEWELLSLWILVGLAILFVTFICSHNVFVRVAYVHVHAYIHTFIHTYILTYLPTYIHTYIHIYIRIRACIHTYIHTCIHTYIHEAKKVGLLQLHVGAHKHEVGHLEPYLAPNSRILAMYDCVGTQFSVLVVGRARVLMTRVPAANVHANHTCTHVPGLSRVHGVSRFRLSRVHGVSRFRLSRAPGVSRFRLSRAPGVSRIRLSKGPGISRILDYPGVWAMWYFTGRTVARMYTREKRLHGLTVTVTVTDYLSRRCWCASGAHRGTLLASRRTRTCRVMRTRLGYFAGSFLRTFCGSVLCVVVYAKINIPWPWPWPWCKVDEDKFT